MSNLLNLFLKHPKVCTDTRKIEAGSIFFALKGANFNGNQFATKALEAGCSFAVIDEIKFKKDERYILVDDVLTALQDLAREYRMQHKAKFIGITGSNGKTTTKELMRDVLAQKYRVQATKGNLNNHIGVPLTLLDLHPDTEIAIIEMGANHQKEIKFLSEIALPDFGLITNIGKAHLEGFGGIEGVKKGKGELFDFIRLNEGITFINTDLDHLEDLAEGTEQVQYQSHGGIYNIAVVSNEPTLCFTWQGQDGSYEVESQLSGEYNIYNFASAIAVGKYYNVPEERISEALRNYVPDNNRSQIIKTESNTLIMDAYNANPSSMELALRSLSAHRHDNKFFIIGDMLELGEETEEEHHKILMLAADMGLRGITVGEHFLSLYHPSFRGYMNTDEARVYLKELNLKDHLILIKGSRGIKLEVLKDCL